ncbi:fimbrial biogenesis chaperone [Stenotrophomonas sp. NPDC101269]|uniref:fimbrial biogenesis chaperone n=1 Tax=Stenotrophomonas TaxID=40323 RepID=UPI0012924BA2|nr:fimbria/pilus periplasmic chaperone [Stenotrophomonas nematodicola]
MASHLHLLIAPRAALLAVLAGLLPGVAAGQALEIAPLQVALPAGSADGELWLHNTHPGAWTGHARLYRWEQTPDRELLTPADDVALSPTRLTIAPGGRQRLRVVRLDSGPLAQERSYRLLLRAGPDSPPLQVSLPVFLAPDGDAAGPPALTVQLGDALPGPSLRLYNDGPRHVRLADLAFVDHHGRRHPLIPGLAGYVLPGRMRQWSLPARAAGYHRGRFQARLDDAAQADLAPATPPIAPAAAAGL